MEGATPAPAILESTMSYRLRECPLCGGQHFKPLLRARDYHYGNPGEYAQAQCTRCTLVFLDPMYDEEELAAFYPNNYYAFGDRFSGSQPVYSLKQRVWRSLIQLEPMTRDPQFSSPGKMLDIGCGSGWFISRMRDQGWDVSGVEPNRGAADFGRSEKGLNIFPGSLMDAKLPDKCFDYVRLNHSFEHMEHPNQILDEIYRVLANDGKLMIGVPNRDSLNARLFGPFWHHLALPVHTFSYSVRTLSAMLRKHNFQVERVVFNTNLTSLLESVQLYINRNDAAPRSQGRLSRSRPAILLCNWAAHLQNRLRIADVIEITAIKRSALEAAEDEPEL
jgi:SAM-dependent methyltransferase